MQAEATPVLVTGAHRTGTTWVGRLLAAAPGMAYVSEPLNVLHRPGVLGAEVRHWYTYVCPDNEQAYLAPFRQLLSFRYHLGAEIASLRSVRDLMRMGRDAANFLWARAARSTALLKDPFAAFSPRWFGERLNCRIVVTVRHPAAFASGLKRLNWSFDFADLLQQPLLMRDHLEPYRERMESAPKDDTVGQAALLWTAIYETLHGLRKLVPSLVFVRHEELSLEPVGGFRCLFRQLGLEFSRRVERLVLDSTSPDNPAEVSARGVHSVKLDSRANLQNWKRRLSSQEIDFVRRSTEGVAELYYPEESWR